MTPELAALALAGLLQVGQLILYSVMANMQVPPEVAFGARDRPVTLTGKTGRIQRAMDNHFAALGLFTTAVVVVTLSGQSTGFTAACGWVYLAARVLYVPAYAFGLSPWRSVLWSIGFIATALMLLAALI